MPHRWPQSLAYVMNENGPHHRSRRLLSRRQVLQVGALGTIGLSLPDFLRAEERAQNARTTARPKSCIFIHQYGGLSQLDSWDMKPHAPQEIRGPYEPIKTARLLDFKFVN